MCRCAAACASVPLQLRSSDNYPNAPGDMFDEIDFEFVSWLGKPCSMWLNSFRG